MRPAFNQSASPEGRPPCAARTAEQGRAKATKAKRRDNAVAPRGSLYDEVTAKIIAQLEDGIFPWVQPWSASSAVPGLPRNAVTGRCYSGVNVLILWGAVIERSFPSQDWLTFKQALAAGGCVRKGEKGETICFAHRFTPDAEKQRATSDGGDAVSIPFLKCFTVFNAAQCDGLPTRIAADAVALPERQLIADAECLIAATGADFRIGGARAFYDVTHDFVQVPPQPAFAHQINYYRTALHELGHWTGTLRGWHGRMATGSATRLTPAKNSAPNWPRPFCAPRSASSRPCATPIIWGLGCPYCARTAARSSRPPAMPARQPTICWPSRPTGPRRPERRYDLRYPFNEVRWTQKASNPAPQMRRGQPAPPANATPVCTGRRGHP